VDFGRLIEEQLRKAREEGKFDNLRGHGQPLNLDENPFEDRTWQMANEMLKRNGFRPEWLEDDIAIREQLAQAQRALIRSREWRTRELAGLAGRSDARAIEQRHWVEQEWRLAQERFRAQLAELNKVIFNFNLKAPSTRFQRVKLDVEAELAKLV
jgi:DnaJ homolog subfamily C member 28